MAFAIQTEDGTAYTYSEATADWLADTYGDAGEDVVVEEIFGEDLPETMSDDDYVLMDSLEVGFVVVDAEE